MRNKRIIAAVRRLSELETALNSQSSIIFLLSTNIEELHDAVGLAHANGKKIFVHIDLADGIGKDEYGIRFVKNTGADGIISTRTNIIKLAKKAGIFTVQRFFIVDSHSVETTVESARASKADMIEIMPGTVTKVITRLKKELDMPIVAGGLIESETEITAAINAGATAVSIGKSEFWGNENA